MEHGTEERRWRNWLQTPELSGDPLNEDQALQRHRFPSRAIKDFPRDLKGILDTMLQEGFHLYWALWCSSVQKLIRELFQRIRKMPTERLKQYVIISWSEFSHSARSQHGEEDSTPPPHPVGKQASGQAIYPWQLPGREDIRNLHMQEVPYRHGRHSCLLDMMGSKSKDACKLLLLS